ncbi:MAG TPA: alkaline phosphatase family protein, partial [Candidatus Baltobacteraceae bacterium]|nr:alkaline phosphatase family protein [Candidatus Baltobacteraceae bacterium]
MRLSLRALLAGAWLGTAGLASGCSSAGQPAAGAVPAIVRIEPLGVSHYIKHVVIIVQENRSFNNIFMGFNGATTQTTGLMSNGQTVTLHASNFGGTDVGHSYNDGLNDWDNGKMDRFDTSLPGGTYAYAYLARKYVKPYWAMATQYALADRMFATEFGASFTAHLDLIAGTTNLNPWLAIADLPLRNPWGCDAPPGTVPSALQKNRTWQPYGGPFPCYTQFKTLADTLDASHVTWKYYAVSAGVFGGKAWSTFASIKHVRFGPDWSTNVVTPQNSVLTDVANGQLAQVSWVTPSIADSDHAGADSDTGPSWVAAVVNAVGHSRYWNDTAIVVLWDEWGGWYDPVSPPQLDFRGLGLRVPCIVISPYAKKSYVSHTQ